MPITMPVSRIASWRVGQFTCRNSCRDSAKKFFMRAIMVIDDTPLNKIPLYSRHWRYLGVYHQGNLPSTRPTRRRRARGSAGTCTRFTDLARAVSYSINDRPITTGKNIVTQTALKLSKNKNSHLGGHFYARSEI